VTVRRSADEGGINLKPSQREALLAAATVAGLVLVLFRQVALGGVMFERDIQLDTLPLLEAFARAVRAGAWPIWDPSSCFGRPLLADPSAEVLYPPTWLSLLIRPERFYGLMVMIHLTLAGSGVFLLGRRLGLGFAPSLVAALLWSASGPLVSLANLWHHFAGACWMPWVLLTAQSAFRSARVPVGLALGACMTGQLLAGSGDMSAMTALAVGLLWLWSLDWRAIFGRDNRDRAAAALLAGGFALALGAAQWLPTLELARASSRWSLPSLDQTSWSLHPASLLEMMFPISLDRLPLQDWLRAALFESREPFLFSVYLGLPTVSLIGAAFTTKSRHLGFLASLALLAALAALGRHTPVLGWLVAFFPPLRLFRYPAKAVLPLSLAWSLLAGAGAQSWLTPERPRGRWLLATVTLPLGLAVLASGLGSFFGVAGRRLPDHPSVASAVTSLAFDLGTAALTAMGVAALAVARNRTARTWPAAVLIVICVLDLTRAAGRLNPTVPLQTMTTPPQAATLLQAAGVSRVYVYEYDRRSGKGYSFLRDDDPIVNRELQASAYVIQPGPDRSDLQQREARALQMYLFPEISVRWRIDTSFQIDARGLYPQRLARLTRVLRGVEGTPAELRLLQLAGVSHVLALHTESFPGLRTVATLPSLFLKPIRILQVPDPLPRTFVVGGARRSDAAEIDALVDPSFDPRREVILPLDAPPPPAVGSGGESRILESQPDRVLIEAQLVGEGYLVLLDTYDPGWRVMVDGAPAPLLRGDVVFRAVRLGPGIHRIEQLYRPRSVLIGLFSSAVASVVGLGAALVLRRKMQLRG
jgi:hypothetical protein